MNFGLGPSVRLLGSDLRTLRPASATISSLALQTLEAAVRRGAVCVGVWGAWEARKCFDLDVLFVRRVSPGVCAHTSVVHRVSSRMAHTSLNSGARMAPIEVRVLANTFPARSVSLVLHAGDVQRFCAEAWSALHPDSSLTLDEIEWCHEDGAYAVTEHTHQLYTPHTAHTCTPHTHAHAHLHMHTHIYDLHAHAQFV